MILFANFVACSDEESMKEEIDSIEIDSFHVSLDDALKSADEFFSQISSTGTRATSSRSVESVSRIALLSGTRSGVGAGVDGNFYLVNYEDDKGFALLSSDKRLPAIYAISDTGSMYIQDTIDNKPLAMFFQSVKYSVAATNANPHTYTWEDFHNYKFIAGAQVPPLLSFGARRFGQENPYNIYCLKNGDAMPAGCTAVATAQIMSYYKWPKKVSFNGSNVNLIWSSIGNGLGKESVAKFLARLGESDLLDIDYQPNGSGANSSNIRQTFEKLGYLKPDPFKSFSESQAIAILNNAKNKVKGSGPLLMSSKMYRLGVEEGHAWVIDGYAKNVTDTINSGTMLNQTGTYFHCVWGKNNGRANGYFLWSSPTIGGENPSAIDGNDFWSDLSFVGYEFQHYDLKYMTNFIVSK